MKLLLLTTLVATTLLIRAAAAEKTNWVTNLHVSLVGWLDDGTKTNVTTRDLIKALGGQRNSKLLVKHLSGDNMQVWMRTGGTETNVTSGFLFAYEHPIGDPIRRELSWFSFETDTLYFPLYGSAKEKRGAVYQGGPIVRKLYVGRMSGECYTPSGLLRGTVIFSGGRLE